MLYILDANVLIDANRDYYNLDRIPEFWDWLIHQGKNENIKVPLEIAEEIRKGNDGLAEWLKRKDVTIAIVLQEESDSDRVATVVENGYADDITDDELEKLGRDPFLIAHALAQPNSRCVVTTEASKPGRQRANRHIPDVCKDLRIRSCNTFQMIRELDFKTSWRSR